jgi:hypothetical protein
MPRFIPRAFTSSLRFKGSTEYVNFPNISAYSFNAGGYFSFMAWFQMVKDTHTTQNFFKKANVGTSGLKVFYEGTLKQFRIEEQSGAFTQAQSNTISPDIRLNDWHHFAFTYDGFAHAVKFYLDATLLTTTDSLTYGGITSDAASDVKIGGDGGANASFDGFLDEVLFYNTLLTQADITAAYYQGVYPSTGRQFYAKFDENTGVSAVDTQNTNTGTLTNSPVWSTNVPMTTRSAVT